MTSSYHVFDLVFQHSSRVQDNNNPHLNILILFCVIVYKRMYFGRDSTPWSPGGSYTTIKCNNEGSEKEYE